MEARINRKRPRAHRAFDIMSKASRSKLEDTVKPASADYSTTRGNRAGS
jgi:hypothetical protein